MRTTTGERVAGDLVVDAMGRRSRAAGWLADAGARPVHEETEDAGFVYYTRYFRGRDAARADRPAAHGDAASISVLTLPGDNDTWSVTVYIASGDAR